MHDLGSVDLKHPFECPSFTIMPVELRFRGCYKGWEDSEEAESWNNVDLLDRPMSVVSFTGEGQKDTERSIEQCMTFTVYLYSRVRFEDTTVSTMDH